MIKKRINLIIFYTFILAPIAAYCTQTKVTGIFEAGWSSCNKTQAQWDGHMQNLVDIGINTVVLQYGIAMGDAKYYPSLLSWAESGTGCITVIPKLLAAADNKNIDVYLGLYYDNAGWWSTVSNSYLSVQKDRVIEVFNELKGLYSGHQSLKGYYLSHEIARYYWKESNDYNRLLSKFLVPVTTEIQAQNEKLIASPFFNATLASAADNGDFFSSLFEHWKPDIVAPQDGIGVNHSTIDNVGEYISILSDAARTYGITPWVNIELFTNDADAPIERVRSQVTAVGGYVEKIISYEYYNFSRSDDPNNLSSLYKGFLMHATDPIFTSGFESNEH